MRFFTLPLCAVLALSAPIHAQKLTPEEEKEGFISLFNGKDFSGWRFSDNNAKAGNWKVEDGVIKLSGGAKPHLASQWDFEDFDIRFEWRAMKAKGYNSGFYIRSVRNVGTNQINLAQDREGEFVGGKIDGAKKVPELQNKPMVWNLWRVAGAGGRVTFWSNGKLAWEGTNLKQLRGYFGLQAEGAPIEFRNIRVKETGYDYAPGFPKWNAKGAKIDGDTIALTPGKGHELTRMEPTGDFTFRTEWKCDKASKAEFWPHGQGVGKAIVFGDLETGSGTVAGGKVIKKADYPLGDWNYLEIKAADGKGSVWLNGTVISKDVEMKGKGAISIDVKDGGLILRAPRVKIAK